MVMSCNINTCDISYFVNFVTTEKRMPFRDGPNGSAQSAARWHRPGMKGQGERHACRLRKEAVCRAPLPAHPSTTGAVADPDRGRPRHFALLHQSDRAQSAPGDRADPAPFGGDL